MKQILCQVTVVAMFKCYWTVYPITESPDMKQFARKSVISGLTNLVSIESKQTSTFDVREVFFVCRINTNRLILIGLKPVPFEFVMFCLKQAVSLNKKLLIDKPFKNPRSLCQNFTFHRTRFDLIKTNLRCIETCTVL